MMGKNLLYNSPWFAHLIKFLDMPGKYDLRERLLCFASNCIEVAEQLPKTIAGIHIGGHLVRSGSSPGLHYGEAQAAESPSDFIHKMKICLKELRETANCLRLIEMRNWYEKEKLSLLQNENNELISIFVTSINTAQKNRAGRTDKRRSG